MFFSAKMHLSVWITIALVTGGHWLVTTQGKSLTYEGGKLQKPIEVMLWLI